MMLPLTNSTPRPPKRKLCKNKDKDCSSSSGQHGGNFHVNLAMFFTTVVFIALMNMNSMCRLEHMITTNIPENFKMISFQKKPLQPTYFTSAVQHLFMPIPSRPANVTQQVKKDIVKAGDFIYYSENYYWDSAPVVIESHKLVFFTVPKVGCTVWKQLFRRMMGYEDWQIQDEETLVPHNPEFNGLKYLYNYSLEEASIMMTSPEWTRAIMVRDPKERFLSAFLDKSVSNDHRHIIQRCCPDESCVEAAQTLDGFLELARVCEDLHWRSQHSRMENKYWSYIDVVGHVENAYNDARTLLERIGAWEKYGASGWGSHGNSSIFANKEVEGAGNHATYSQWQIWKWYTPEIEAEVEQFYMEDYENPLFNFTKAVCLTCM